MFLHQNLHKEIIKTLEKIRIPKNVILYGSFSKNEGTFLKKGNEFVPYNDIDLIFIDNKLNKNDIIKYKEILKRNLKTDFIDIDLMTYSELKSLNKSIFSFDLYCNGLVLHGEYDLKSSMFDKKDISLKDIEILFRTRMWTLIGSINYTGNRIQAIEKHFFSYQISKCIFAIIDCLLVIKKDYTSKYEDKISKAYKLKELDDYHHLIEYAKDIKLNNFKFAKNLSNIFLYYETAELFLKTFELGLSMFFNVDLTLDQIVIRKYQNSVRSFLFRKLYYLKGVNGDLKFNLILIQFTLIRFFLGKEIDKNQLQILGKKIGVKKYDIEKIRSKTAQLRLL